jgi:hypothetical protein
MRSNRSASRAAITIAARPRVVFRNLSWVEGYGESYFGRIARRCRAERSDQLPGSTFCQVESGSNRAIALARAAVSGPRSFSYTTPSWLTVKVITPVSPYLTGHATAAKPPILRPRGA